MTLETQVSGDGAILTLAVKGKFDFNLLAEFRQAYSGDDAGYDGVVVDLRETTSVDSSALGMLLNMQRYLKMADGTIRIVHCNPDVKKILHIVRFDKKFTIE
jgi:anti-anti-sigma factor